MPCILALNTTDPLIISDPSMFESSASFKPHEAVPYLMSKQKDLCRGLKQTRDLGRQAFAAGHYNDIPTTISVLGCLRFTFNRLHKAAMLDSDLMCQTERLIDQTGQIQMDMWGEHFHSVLSSNNASPSNSSSCTAYAYHFSHPKPMTSLDQFERTLCS